jgi:hypothetical protein
MGSSGPNPVSWISIVVPHHHTLTHIVQTQILHGQGAGQIMLCAVTKVGDWER